MKPNALTMRLSTVHSPPQHPPTQRPTSAAQLDLPEAAVTTLVFIFPILCFFMLCTYCRRCSTGGGGGARSARGGHHPLMHQGDLSYSSVPKPTTSLPPELPVVLYAAGADVKEEEKEPAGDCVVCLGEFEEDKELKVIPGCGHLFHPQCIDAWLVLHGSCPVCRCSQLFGATVGEGRVEVCVHAMGKSSGEEETEEKSGAAEIREEFGMGRREREEMGRREGDQEGKDVEGRRYCCSCSCSSSSSSSRRDDGCIATQL